MQLTGKVAVITGAASGIGAGTARRFAAEGAKVVVADVDDANGKLIAAEIDGAFVHCDAADERDVEASVAAAVEAYSRLDCYFANAGFGGVSGPITDLDVAGFDSTVGVLLRGVAIGMKHAAKVMIPQGSGSIISTASVAGLQGGLGPHVYSACKAGVIGITRSVALELAEHGIRVNAICPGGILTNIFASGMGAEGEQIEQINTFMAEMLKKAQPMTRAGQPADIAGAALWLAGDDSAFVTGQAIVVDGGLTSSNGLSRRAAEEQPARPPT